MSINSFIVEVHFMGKLFSFIVAISLVLTFAFTAVSTAEAYSYRVRGYTRSSGTYVQPYYKTSPNYTRWDNYSTRGNYNPYSGRYGTRNPW